MLAWPVGNVSQRFWFRISEAARLKMEKTTNVFPVPWRKVLSHIRHTDGEDVLNESKYIYLMFLITYWLVEFPALRLVLAYDFVTKNSMTTSDRIGLAAVLVLIALLLLPLFLVVWTTLVMWSIVQWTAKKIWMLPFHAWSIVEDQSDKRSIVQEKGKSDEEDKDKGNRETKKVEDQNEENLRQARKEREDRVRKQVSLLLNPKQLYQDKIEPYNGKIKALTLRKRKNSSEKRNVSVVSGQTLPV